MVTHDTLVVGFPEFSDATKYPVATVDFWIQQAYLQLSVSVYGASMDLAVMLWVAHNLVLAAQSAASVAIGGGGGAVQGVLSARSVGPLSKSFDTGSVMEEGAGFYNSTTYGQRFWRMMQGYTLGPRYVPGPNRRVSAYPSWPRR